VRSGTSFRFRPRSRLRGAARHFRKIQMRLPFRPRAPRASRVLRRECLALHTIDQWAAIQRRDGDPKSSLRQAVDGELGFAAKAVTCETLRKAFERLRIHRLRAIQRRAPGTEVDTLDVFVGDLAHAKFISKIRRGGDRAAMFVKRLQPALGARQKASGDITTNGIRNTAVKATRRSSPCRDTAGAS